MRFISTAQLPPPPPPPPPRRDAGQDTGQSLPRKRPPRPCLGVSTPLAGSGRRPPRTGVMGSPVQAAAAETAPWHRTFGGSNSADSPASARGPTPGPPRRHREPETRGWRPDPRLHRQRALVPSHGATGTPGDAAESARSPETCMGTFLLSQHQSRTAGSAPPASQHTARCTAQPGIRQSPGYGTAWQD